MARKAPQQTNILIHMLVWTLGTPLIFVILAGGLFLAINAPRDETFTVSVFAAVAGIFIGFPLGIISFFVVRGARGWGRYFDGRRAEQAAETESEMIEQVENEIADHLLDSGTLSASSDPWNGTNPYGCCQDNYDAEGNLSHGSPDCLHPLILEERRAS